MKNILLSGIRAAFLAATIMCLGLTARAQSLTTVTNNGVTVKVWAASAPNTTSADYIPYATRIRDWILAGSPAASKPAEIKDNITVGDLISSSTDSSGRRIHFPLMIEGNKKLNVASVSWVIKSSDSFNALKFESGLSGLPYDPITRTGVDFGPDNVRGGGNDVVRNNETGSNPVNSLLYVGAGNGFRGNNPDEIAQATAFFNANRPFGITITYHITFVDGTSMDVGANISSMGVPTLSWVEQGSNVTLSLAVTGDATGATFDLQGSTQFVPSWVPLNKSISPGQPVTLQVDPAKPTMFFRAYRP